MLALVALPAAQAAVTVTGTYWLDPWDPASLNGPDLLMPGSRLFLGSNSSATFEALAGAKVELAQLSLGQSGFTALAVLDGVGTRMSLHSNGYGNRLDVGNAGVGRLTVSGGALLDGRADATACLVGPQYCGNFVGNGAGSDGQFIITGAGSEARLLHAFVVGGINVNGSFGTAGATTHGRVDVLDGGTLRTDQLVAGVSNLGPNSNGLELSEALINLHGAGSFWEISGGALPNARADLILADGRRATTTANVGDGALWRVQPIAGSYATMLVGQNGGNGTLNVSASRIEILAPVQSFFGVGRDGGTGSARFDAGSVLQMTAGRSDIQIGQGNGNGSLLLDNSRIEMGLNDTHMGVGIEGGTGLLSLNHGAEAGVGYAVFGRAGGTGSLQIESGARFMSGSNVDIGHGGIGQVLINSAGVLEAASLNMGGWGNGQGTAVLDGAGSLIALSRIDGHRLSLGDWGKGSLVVSGGALLDAAGKAADCVNKWCGAMVGHAAGSQGWLTITGAGSEARFLSGFSVGGTQVATAAIEGWTIGTAGGTGRGRVEVLDGGLLRTKEVSTGVWNSASANGQERSFAEGLVAGAGSRWLIQGSESEGHDARLMLASSANSYADWKVQGGGELLVIAPTGRNANVDLGNGGQATLAVYGAGSRLFVSGVDARLVAGIRGGRGDIVVADSGALELLGSAHSYLNLGESGGEGELKVLSGGRVSGARDVNVGDWRGNGQGTVLIDGAGSRLDTLRSGGVTGLLTVNQGKVSLLAGGQASAFALQVAPNELLGHAEAVIDGKDSAFSLHSLDWHRLSVEKGSVIVSGGGLLDGAADAAACTGHWCGAFLANNAGGDASLTVAGAGSRASFLSTLIAGGSYVTAPPATPYTSGQPGAASRVRINVLDGGRLDTEAVRLGHGPQGSAANGAESVQVDVKLSGAGSLWRVAPGSPGSTLSSFVTGAAGGANSLVDIAILQGGRLELEAPTAGVTSMYLAREGGQTLMTIDGAGSALSLSGGDYRWLDIGRLAGHAQMQISNGATVSGANYLRVGISGGTGLLGLSGSGSRLTLQTDGLLGDGSDQAAWNPSVRIGDQGRGTLLVEQGAVMTVSGQAASTASDLRITTLEIGRSYGSLVGAGLALVSGAGSLLKVQGVDARLIVGLGTNGDGQLKVQDQARLETTLLHIGSSGGTGQLRVDNAEVKLSGQWTSDATGAGVTVGRGMGSSGQVQLNNGAKLMISNLSDAGAFLDLGGGRVEFGSGMLTVTGASQVKLAAAPGLASVNIGRSGTGIASFDGASSLDVGDGSVYIGRKAGAVGVLTLAGNSTLNAAYVGVGSEPGVDTGVGTLIVNASTLSASTLEIGAKGFVGGNGVLNANIINRGVFNPGNSPGTLTLGGDFTNQAGGRLVLEVQSNATGGFDVDQLVFADASLLDLSGLQIGFRFLGTTDPNAFQVSGKFQIDNFMKRSGGAGLDDALFSGVSFAASSDDYNFQSFSFTAAGGAVFAAQAVPEPMTWLMLLTGLALLLQRRRYPSNSSRAS
ncbi:beta strand repeat-containing protein [Paucibacter sp. B2R-40]|uniref:beta strand repeat-containing protein n=1 Tax=Paucibacter sp. B2R-40 TaxID=2893554 RepID=UPI0021E38BBE|nr:PEP-CTERM sorting domain-containing protein [Paucibacter sp. B2R-40]